MRLVAVFLVASLSACAGRAVEDPPDPDGPPQTGVGVYRLHATARSNDCEPPAMLGEGEAVVAVKVSGDQVTVNVPLEVSDPRTPDMLSARSDFSLGSVWESTNNFLFNCPDARSRRTGKLTSISRNHLRIEWTHSVSGGAACGIGDCEIALVNDYDWVRECSMSCGDNVACCH
jgi:hypothetical protein